MKRKRVVDGRTDTSKYAEMILALPFKAFEHGILSAISGGADSVALLHMLVQDMPKEGKLAIAHVNHGLRGADSDVDATFVRSLAEEYKLRYFEHRIEPATTLSENTARNLRYNFLTQQAERIGFRYLATAHTADDQTETVLHRILRGTGLSGLAGITPLRSLTPAVSLLRPLLSVRRTAIVSYLESHGKIFREDKTNIENQFTRNRIRNKLLPILRKEFNPQVDEAVCRLATLAAEHEFVVSELLEELTRTARVEESPNQIILDAVSLQHYSTSVFREMLISIWKRKKFPQREMDYRLWSALAELFRSANNQRLDLPGGISAERKHNLFVITKNSEGLPPEPVFSPPSDDQLAKTLAR